MHRLLKWVAPVVIASLLAPSALAQGPGGGGPGGFQIPPEARAKMERWRKWRENHKNFETLQQTLAGIGECEKTDKTKLTQAQAQKILAILKKYNTKPILTNDEAGIISKDIAKVLTVEQLKKVATAPRFGGRGMGRGGGGMGGGMGRPGGGQGGPGMGRPGGGPGGGGRPPFDFSRIPEPKDYNPLNPATMPDSPFKQMAVTRMNTMMKNLETRARGGA